MHNTTNGFQSSVPCHRWKSMYTCACPWKLQRLFLPAPPLKRWAIKYTSLTNLAHITEHHPIQLPWPMGMWLNCWLKLIGTDVSNNIYGNVLDCNNSWWCVTHHDDSDYEYDRTISWYAITRCGIKSNTFMNHHIQGCQSHPPVTFILTWHSLWFHYRSPRSCWTSPTAPRMSSHKVRGNPDQCTPQKWPVHKAKMETDISRRNLRCQVMLIGSSHIKHWRWYSDGPTIPHSHRDIWFNFKISCMNWLSCTNRPPCTNRLPYTNRLPCTFITYRHAIHDTKQCSPILSA